MKKIVGDSWLILPVGTQIVSRTEIRGQGGEVLCPRGAVGIIIKAPDDGSHSYRVRFSNGVESALRRPELVVRKYFQAEQTGAENSLLAQLALYDFVIYRCIVGSRAFGLETDEST